ncbi:MAG: PepSY-associated TM helix domain-containing protein [Sphingomonas sp.]
MAKTTTMKLRGLWLSVHKWIGILLAILIIPISLTGSALVWHDWLDETVNPQRFTVKSGEPALTPAAYAAAAQGALAPGEQVAQLRYPEGGDGPIVASATRPLQPGVSPRTRTNVWLDPADGRVLDKAGSGDGLVMFMHVLHGNLLWPGLGRTIVGWVGVFMFLSCLTGIWLWWPVTGSVRRGFRWKRQNSTNANLHHQMGFWIMVPLAILSFSGFWISFPGIFGAFEPAATQQKGRPPNRERAMRARPLERTAMTPEAALAAARPQATGRLVSITWPTDQAPEWKVAFAREGGPAEVTVADGSGEVTAPRPPRAETRARFMRRLHDGTGMGLAWQIIIFIGGIIPALLAVTGIIMWLRQRGWRAALAKKRKERLTPQPAE